MTGRAHQYEPLEQALGYTFKGSSCSIRALTHRSYAAASGGLHNERLEFLGDAARSL